ncbi:hypothetical protein PF008_g24774 [Phytophthora fragariae]|uniref:Uncharacterized protein n=1 Tax=Phytophthora fragariae TaxID=53985 RepID=A0A6G0QMI6_9STRA|nr:hypothetical protein PF008_g24774 [Phytophthora fragariae]
MLDATNRSWWRAVFGTSGRWAVFGLLGGLQADEWAGSPTVGKVKHCGRSRGQPLGQDIRALLQGAPPVDANGSRGLPVSPGAAMGNFVFKAAEDEAWFKWGKNAVLVC